ncbi:alpha/beta hydrolase fold domain-containing protein [Corynebacterium tuberculostearicum]|uniref:alpha/beta hydrolase fold domain-containing protein n=1 Tax=Corynebacterium tuberculostearicum TaxID=38304 RepID=UPI0023B86D23|nr:alpha/beta hydrolase fold domain-containing protein [Corynebacterium tuberculostearicum]
MYLGDDHLDVDLPPYASPATSSDLSGLPPTWIGVGGIDLFCDESVAFAQASTPRCRHHPRRGPAPITASTRLNPRRHNRASLSTPS